MIHTLWFLSWPSSVHMSTFWRVLITQVNVTYWVILQVWYTTVSTPFQKLKYWAISKWYTYMPCLENAITFRSTLRRKYWAILMWLCCLCLAMFEYMFCILVAFNDNSPNKTLCGFLFECDCNVHVPETFNDNFPTRKY